MHRFSRQIYKLIYVSSSAEPMDEGELLTLLEKSRIKNKARNITGLLLYHENQFFQLLEGSKEEVDHLYRIIEKDKRHLNVTPLIRDTDGERDFPDWSMGYRRLDQLEDEQLIEGFNRILESNPQEEINGLPISTETSTFLNMFKTIVGII
ncbi:MAG: BLUF domain-containing protein [Anaerolineae bacterium]